MDSGIKIHSMGVVDLLEKKRFKCGATVGKTSRICGKNATLIGIYDGKTYYLCKSHKSKYKPIIDDHYDPAESGNTCSYVKPKVGSECGKKSHWTKNGKTYCNQHKKKLINDAKKSVALKPLKKVNSLKVNPQDLAVAMFNKLDTIEGLLDVDTVYIEHQPVLKNPTMKTVATILFGYFIAKGVQLNKTKNVKFVLASNKLKVDSNFVQELISSSTDPKLKTVLDRVVYRHMLGKTNKEIKDDKGGLFEKEFVDKYNVNLKDVIDQLVAHLVNKDMKKKKSIPDFSIDRKTFLSFVQKVEKDSDNYKITKLLAVKFTKILLKKFGEDKWIDFIEQRTKQDDLCDAFLQGYYILNN